MAAATNVLDHRDTTFPTPFESAREGMWTEVISQDPTLRQVVVRRPFPTHVLQSWARLAVRRAVVKQLDEGWFAEIEGFGGVWAHEASAQEALEELESVVFDWALLKICDADQDIPVVGDIDPNLF